MREVEINFLDSWIASKCHYTIYIDGIDAGTIRNGQCRQYPLSEDAHLIRFMCHSEYGSGFNKETIMVSPDKYDKKYHVKPKFGGLIITEDVELAALNQKLYDEEQMAISRYKKEQGYIQQTSALIEKVESSEIGKRDYSILVKELTKEQRSISGYKNLMRDYVKDMMRKAVDAFPDKSLMYDYIHDLSTINECAGGMRPLLKHISFVGNPEVRMKSIFDDKSDIREQIENLRKNMQEEFADMSPSDIGALLYKKVQKYDVDVQQFKKLATQGDNYKALRKITFADDEDDYEATLGQLPKYLFYDAFLDKREGDVLQLSMYIKKTYEQLFCCGRKAEDTGEIIYYPTTDMLIAGYFNVFKRKFHRKY